MSPTREAIQVNYLRLSWVTGMCISYLERAVEALLSEMELEKALQFLEAKPNEACRRVTCIKLRDTR